MKQAFKKIAAIGIYLVFLVSFFNKF